MPLLYMLDYTKSASNSTSVELGAVWPKKDRDGKPQSGFSGGFSPKELSITAPEKDSGRMIRVTVKPDSDLCGFFAKHKEEMSALCPKSPWFRVFVTECDAPKEVTELGK